MHNEKAGRLTSGQIVGGDKVSTFKIVSNDGVDVKGVPYCLHDPNAICGTNLAPGQNVTVYEGESEAFRAHNKHPGFVHTEMPALTG